MITDILRRLPLLLLAGAACLCAACSAAPADESPSAALPVPDGPAAEGLRFVRESAGSITLLWSDSTDPAAGGYRVLRSPLPAGAESWETLAELPSDTVSDGTPNTYTDLLPDTVPQQYLYRIDLLPAGSTGAVPGTPIPASNVLLCLDPGHYENSAVLGTEDGYSEGAFTLPLALALRDILRDSCGISCLLTRESGSIRLGGYADLELDSAHITLRGEYAFGCDLFLSLHTNATLGDANGYPALAQPITVDKPILIANAIAAEDSACIALANAVGRNLSTASAAAGIAALDTFRDAVPGTLPEWTDAINDAPGQPGSVYIRLNEDNGEDYYGVLRGAAAVGVPGFIIEHGHHAVPEMRRAAMGGTLAPLWAQADAAGIAEGYGFSLYTAG